MDEVVQERSKQVQALPHIRKHVDRLERGWAWFENNPDHPQFEAREDRWIEWLREYERDFDEAMGR